MTYPVVLLESRTCAVIFGHYKVSRFVIISQAKTKYQCDGRLSLTTSRISPKDREYRSLNQEK